MEEQITSPDQTALADQLGVYANYEIASTGQRFVNYLVDNVLMQYGLGYLTGTIVGYFIAGYFPDYAYKIAYNPSFVDNLIIGYPIVILNYLFYYSLCEKLFKGYTLGKLISGTRAIRVDGSEPH